MRPVWPPQKPPAHRPWLSEQQIECRSTHAGGPAQARGAEAPPGPCKLLGHSAADRRDPGPDTSGPGRRARPLPLLLGLQREALGPAARPLAAGGAADRLGDRPAPLPLAGGAGGGPAAVACGCRWAAILHFLPRGPHGPTRRAAWRPTLGVARQGRPDWGLCTWWAGVPAPRLPPSRPRGSRAQLAAQRKCVAGRPGPLSLPLQLELSFPAHHPPCPLLCALQLPPRPRTWRPLHGGATSTHATRWVGGALALGRPARLPARLLEQPREGCRGHSLHACSRSPRVEGCPLPSHPTPHSGPPAPPAATHRWCSSAGR